MTRLLVPLVGIAICCALLAGAAIGYVDHALASMTPIGSAQ